MFRPNTVPLPKSSVTGVFSELNQYRSSIRTVSDQYACICVRPVWIACLRAVFVELIQSCRTDTDPIYSSISDPLLKSSVAFLGTDLDQIGPSSDSKRRILLCKGTFLAKMNVEIAYRIVPVHLDNKHFLSIYNWNSQVDAVLPFGLHSVPLISTALADALSGSCNSGGHHTLPTI